MEWVCERCAADDEDLVLVRRPDVPEAGAVDGGPTAELWCFDCRSTTAHVEVDEQG